MCSETCLSMVFLNFAQLTSEINPYKHKNENLHVSFFTKGINIKLGLGWEIFKNTCSSVLLDDPILFSTLMSGDLELPVISALGDPTTF